VRTGRRHVGASNVPFEAIKEESVRSTLFLFTTWRKYQNIRICFVVTVRSLYDCVKWVFTGQLSGCSPFHYCPECEQYAFKCVQEDDMSARQMSHSRQSRRNRHLARPKCYQLCPVHTLSFHHLEKISEHTRARTVKHQQTYISAGLSVHYHSATT